MLLVLASAMLHATWSASIKGSENPLAFNLLQEGVALIAALLILPLSAVFYNTVQFLLTLPILAVFVVVAGIEPDVTWVVGIPILLILQFLLVVGLGTLLASLNVFFRDLGPLLDVVLLLMFYTSAVIFPLSRVPEASPS